MALSYKEKMGVSQRLLEAIRLRLTSKASEVLPPEGIVSDEDPSDCSLIGGLAPRPDPDYHREQAPSAMGMVLMVEPDQEGKITLDLSGRFDLTHRYIPSIQTMRASIQVGPDGDKSRQRLPECYKRFSVVFNDIELTVTSQEVNAWKEMSLDSVLRPVQDAWKTDPRVFRACQLNDRGWANQIIPWTGAHCETDEELADLVRRSLFVSQDILEHQIVLRVRLRPPPPNFVSGNQRYLLEVYLQNNTDSAVARQYGLLKPCLLDVVFEAVLKAGSQFDVPHRLLPEDYRYQAEDGIAGYGVTCSVRKLRDDCFRTDSMPVFAQPRVDAPTPQEVGMALSPSFSLLAEQPLAVLDGFLAALCGYNATWDAVEADLAGAGKLAELKEVQTDRAAYRQEVDLITEGVELLREHDDLLQCFAWMNEAMGKAIALQGKSFDGWHLFQLGFILSQVRAVFERHCMVHERHNVADTADVLWFATGGGKTEAYLGIIVFAMLYGRKRGRHYGTTAWMRFPLRMLSAQQFQRLSYVVAQAEMLRCREGIKGHPFTVGYYTGSGTPGSISRSEAKGSAVWLPDLAPDQLQRFQFITDCPYCGTRRSLAMVKDVERSRLLHRCANTECWSNEKSGHGDHGEGIPREIGIYVSDEECYRYLPTVLVGTVDKLAVIAHNERFAGYFGAFRHFCPEHGFTADAKCKHQRIVLTVHGEYEARECGNNSRTSRVRTVQLAPMLDPGFPLLIQDELHLLRESLGNFDAHYETLMQSLQIGHGGQASKVLAATATIKDFENHILHLYMRPGRRFPAPGAKRGESFYARVSYDSDGPLTRRWFAGILPLSFTRGGTERAAAEIASRFLDQIDHWREGLSSGVASVIEQLGFSTSRAPELLEYIGKYLNTDLIYAIRKRQTTFIREHLENLNSRRVQPRTHVLLDGQTPLDDILSAIHKVESKVPSDPMRHIVATSVVSHGVDISELNFMVLDGWPSSTAEYIQSSARSGRTQPGIVMSVLSPGKLFESGVFLNFGDYHFFLEKLVDSVPINRFAPNVLNRTLPGVFTAVVYNWAKFQPGWGRELNRSASQLHKALNDPAGIARQKLREMLIGALDVPPNVQTRFDIRVLGVFRKQLSDEVDRGLHRLQNLAAANVDKDLGTALESIYQFGPMRSFRDIENQVGLTPLDTKSANVLSALGR
ncbi:hypothetical protein LMG27952_02631 [Paraburkholderia hiiakae]|uniref:Helicase C-terminal domain-containing protein n=1 Tax=Paraburkholderia hiiakae TaxID=1081782 RepID=A0ABM8NLP3_9BURK|nr:helicase C-terminal domain-containing protein [Paraburkholderia hiiakae]CAD6531874.1 hypothetical protein LMG27952_02631 [Paraburkholderia hiiakae]